MDPGITRPDAALALLVATLSPYEVVKLHFRPLLWGVLADHLTHLAARRKNLQQHMLHWIAIHPDLSNADAYQAYAVAADQWAWRRHYVAVGDGPRPCLLSEFYAHEWEQAKDAWIEALLCPAKRVGVWE